MAPGMFMWNVNMEYRLASAPRYHSLHLQVLLLKWFNSHFNVSSVTLGEVVGEVLGGGGGGWLGKGGGKRKADGTERMRALLSGEHNTIRTGPGTSLQKKNSFHFLPLVLV